MKQLKYFLLFVVVACSSPKVVYDYNTELNFKQYKTFNFFEDVGKGMNKFDVERITKELKINLKKKGIRQEENPDFYVNVLSKVKRQPQRNSVGVSIGGGNGGFGYGISGGVSVGGRKLYQQITIDFVDGKNDELIWQGVSDSEISERINPKERDIYYKKLIEKVIKGFPPKKE